MRLPKKNWCAFGVASLLAGMSSQAATTNIFSTQFEPEEGYNLNLDLAGQNGWLQSGSGGNGLVDESIAGEGQQAYIGFSPPDPGEDLLILWRPVNYTPVPATTPVVQFSVTMAIVDSTNERYDDFYWSVYNAQGTRLFSLDFDNNDFAIYYLLDGTNDFVWTGEYFESEVVHELVVTMNFASNLWSATLDNIVLVTNKPISTAGSPLNLGDVDAVWFVRDVNNPGDNYMLFDNYSITAEILTPPQPVVQVVGRTLDGQIALRISGESGARFALEASTNLEQWTPLRTNTVNGGSFDYIDTAAPAHPRRFYRARWVP